MIKVLCDLDSMDIKQECILQAIAAVQLTDAMTAVSYTYFSSVSVFYRFGSSALCFPPWTDGASATFPRCQII